MITLHSLNHHQLPELSQNQKRRLTQLMTTGNRVRIFVRASGHVTPQYYSYGVRWDQAPGWRSIDAYIPYSAAISDRLDRFWETHQDDIIIVRQSR